MDLSPRHPEWHQCLGRKYMKKQDPDDGVRIKSNVLRRREQAKVGGKAFHTIVKRKPYMKYYSVFRKL
jgi:hypothetical protein